MDPKWDRRDSTVQKATIRRGSRTVPRWRIVAELPTRGTDCGTREIRRDRFLLYVCSIPRKLRHDQSRVLAPDGPNGDCRRGPHRHLYHSIVWTSVRSNRQTTGVSGGFGWSNRLFRTLFLVAVATVHGLHSHRVDHCHRPDLAAGYRHPELAAR